MAVDIAKHQQLLTLPAWAAAPATKVLARTTSRVVTPMSFFGSYTPAAFSVSAAIGTVLFTGLLMMLMIACIAAVSDALTLASRRIASLFRGGSCSQPGIPLHRNTGAEEILPQSTRMAGAVAGPL